MFCSKILYFTQVNLPEDCLLDVEVGTCKKSFDECGWGSEDCRGVVVVELVSLPPLRVGVGGTVVVCGGGGWWSGLGETVPPTPVLSAFCTRPVNDANCRSICSTRIE